MSDREALYTAAIKLPPSSEREQIISYVVRAERLSILGHEHVDLASHLVNFCVDHAVHERSDKDVAL